MSKGIGRLGSLGIAIEATAGSAEASPDAFLNYIDISLKEMSEPIPIISAHTRREEQIDSIKGKQWGEGDVSIPLDVQKAGYLLKMALGNEQLTAGTPNEHLFYPTVSGNAPKTATLWYERINDVIQATYATVNTLELNVTDGIGTLNANLLSEFPSVDGSQTLATTSGTIFSFANYTVKLGTNISDAEGNSATKLSEFKLTINNNAEAIHLSGSNDVESIRTKQLQAEGSFVLYFDTVTERDAYRALSKRALVAEFTGNTNETMYIRIPHMRSDSWEIDTGLDDYYMETCNFVCELDTSQVPNFLDIRLDNDKGTVY